MKKHHSTALFGLIFCIVLAAILYSCSKTDQAAPSEAEKTSKISIAEVKEWYNQKHAEDRAILSSSKERLTSYAPGTFVGDPAWDAYRYDAVKNIIYVPLDHTTGKTGNPSFRDLLITKDSLGKFREYVQKIRFDSAYLAGQVKAKGDLPIRAYSDPEHLTGTVFLYSTNNFLIEGVTFEKGTPVNTLKPKPGSLGTVGIGSNLLKSYVTVGGEGNDDCSGPSGTECDEVIVKGYTGGGNNYFGGFFGGYDYGSGAGLLCSNFI